MLTHARLREVLHYNRRTGVFTWRVQLAARGKQGTQAGGPAHSGYRRLRIDGTLYYEHRLAWFYVTGKWPTGLVDHKKHLGNRFSNLRDATAQINAQNKRRATKTNRSRLLGVCQLPDGRWKSQIKAGGRNLHLGYFPNADQAHGAYVGAKRVLHPGCTL